MRLMIRDRRATVYRSVRVRHGIQSYDTVDDLESIGITSMGRTGLITRKAEPEGLVIRRRQAKECTDHLKAQDQLDVKAPLCGYEGLRRSEGERDMPDHTWTATVD
jgi:hypothetical protein